ncbi:MAG: hypothetical protein AUI14_21915 [Actinobacteria bacterium 13_2_20CM_2_71_6]|nr:MAG: hypothetical protein AUI14_21915 [Actinobacteria bacterium 13_2_20CM_2_71_6]
MRRAPGIRTADSPWSSAGAALEPTMEPASTGWRRSLTSGLRGRAEVRSRYADLLAPVSPAVPPTNPRAGEVPASAPPYPYEGDLEGDQPHRAWAAPPQIPAERPAPRPEIEPYHAYRPNGALVDNTFEDLPAVAAQAAAASKAAQAAAQAASAVQAARAAEAAAEAQAVVEDHAAVEAAYRAAVTQGGTDTPAPPNGAGPARVEPRHPAAFRPPADFRPARQPGGVPSARQPDRASRAE